MYLGTQVQARNDDDFKQWAQLGVLNICSDPPGNPHLWSEDDLLSHKEKVNSFGIELDMVQIPLSSQVLEKSILLILCLEKALNVTQKLNLYKI